MLPPEMMVRPGNNDASVKEESSKEMAPKALTQSWLMDVLWKEAKKANRNKKEQVQTAKEKNSMWDGASQILFQAAPIITISSLLTLAIPLREYAVAPKLNWSSHH